MNIKPIKRQRCDDEKDNNNDIIIDIINNNDIFLKLKNIGGDYYHLRERCFQIEFMKELHWKGPGDFTEYVTQLLDEFWKFLILKKDYDDISPSPDVDKIWHEMLLYTELYRKACHIIKGKIIHHRPITPCDLRQRYKKTLQLYDQFYCDRNEKFWPDIDTWKNTNNDVIIVEILNKSLPHILSFPNDTIDNIRTKIQETIDFKIESLFIYGKNSDIFFFDKETSPYMRVWIQNTSDVLTGNDGENIQLFIKTLTGLTITLHVNTLYTIQRLRFMIELNEGIPANQQRLVFSGKQVEDEKSLMHYDIHDGCTMHLTLRLRGC
jgi:hypothetical protein